MAAFHMGTCAASMDDCGIESEATERAKVQKERERWSYETNWEMGWWVQVHIPLRRAIER